MAGQNEIKVSIIMPVYNAAEFLQDSIGDILAQTFTDFELICVNDGSTDESKSILEDMESSDNRICVINQENRGGGAARNCGIQYATGKYILFLDADDRFDQDLLSLVVEKAEETNSDIVVFDADAFDNETGNIRSLPKLIKKKRFQNGDDVFSSFNMTVWNKLFLRQFVEEHRFRFTERKAAYSMSFVALSFLYADKISLVDKVLLHYRTNNPNSNLANEDKDPTAIYDAVLEVKDKLIADGLFVGKYDMFLRMCEESLIARFNVMRTSKGYLQLYNRLHDNEEELLLTDSNIAGGSEVDFITAIRDKNAAEYLFDQRMNIITCGITGIECFALPDLQLQSDKEIRDIVLYGGGDVGLNYFNQIKRKGKYQIVGWVDNNYKKIGWPIQSPDVLKELDYDAILIAVVDEKVADSIKSAIIGMGISEDKIHWEAPIRI